MADLNAASVDDVASFFKTYYAPNNAVVAIVGDVDTKATIEKVRKAFGPIPVAAAPPRMDLTEPQAERRTATDLEDPPRPARACRLAYKMPPRLTADDDAIQVLGTVMSSGRSSRLYQQLVRQQLSPSPSRWTRPDGRARIVLLLRHGRAGQDHRRGREGDPRRDRAAEDGPIEPWELEKARNNAKRAVVGGLTSSLQHANLLADFAANFGDPSLINQRVDRISKVTAADVQRVARTYLTAENRTVVVTVPKPAPEPRESAMKTSTSVSWRSGRRRDAVGHARRVAFWRASSARSPKLPPAAKANRRRRPGQAVVMKGKAPVSTSAQIKLPRPNESTFSNGLHVMVLEDRRAPQVSMQLIDARRRRLFRSARSDRARAVHRRQPSRGHAG